MSTAGLPFYVRDLSMWEFHEACMEQHLEKSQGVVGRALLSHCVGYCEDVTKLSEEEYPLVRNACTSGLGGCFAIFLRGVGGKNDYILEFFMPLDIKDSIDSYVLNLVQKLKLKIEDASGFEMGDISSMEVIRPPSVVTNISSMTEVDTPNGIIPHPFVTNVATIACGAYVNVSMQKTRDKGNDAGEPSRKRLIRNIKRKRDSLTMEAVEKQVGQPMDEASKSLGVSRSTLKRFLRDHSIPRWPMSKLRDISACVTDSNQHLVYLNVTNRRVHINQILTIIRIVEMHYMIHVLYIDASLAFKNSKEEGCLSDPSFYSVSFSATVRARTAMAHQNDPVVFSSTKYIEQATNNVDPLMDVDLDKVTDLNFVDAIPRLSGADFNDDHGCFLKMAGCSSGSVLDYLMEPDGIENAMAELFHSSGDLSFSTTVGARGRFLSKPTIHVYYVAKLIVRLRRWKKRSFVRIAMAHQEDSLVFENTTNMEQATDNVDPLMARTAMAHQNDPVVFDCTTYMEQATNNVEPLMDGDVTDLYLVNEFTTLSGDGFIDGQGSILKMAGCSSGSVHDYRMEPDGIENALAEMGKWLEGDWPPPIGSGDMYSFGANYDFSNPVFDDHLFY